MKKFLIALTVGLIATLATTNRAQAQNSVNPEVLEPQKNVSAVEKAVSNDNTTALPGISVKALKHFGKSYKNVSGETWEKTREGFTARFNDNGVRSTVYYTPNGRWAGSLKNYNEDKMSAEIRKIVKREYYDYSITYVQEAQTIDSEGTPTYIIHLEDKNSIRLVRIHDGQMDTWQAFRKQQ